MPPSVWPNDAVATTLHFAEAGVNFFDIIDVVAKPKIEITQEFVILERNGLSLDVPKSLSGELPNDTKLPLISALRIALIAWNKADPLIKCAFAQGRARQNEPLYRSLSKHTAVCHEVPYTLAVAMRALRPDIQKFVGQATFQLVTRAPNHTKINEFFEACLEKPLKFQLHTIAWKRVRRAFKDLSCSGKIVKTVKHATIQLESAYIATTRRDLILIVLVLLFNQSKILKHEQYVGNSLNEILKRFKWLKPTTLAEHPWWW